MASADAAVGRRTGVAQTMGVNFSGIIAWCLWRSIYLSKLPRFEKKVCVALDRMPELLFMKDSVQFLTVRAEAVSHDELAARSRETIKNMPGRALPPYLTAAGSLPEGSPASPART